MKKELQFGKSIIQYHLIQSGRLKTSQITVDRDNVIVRAPNFKTNAEIEDLVSQKAKWIYAKQLEFKRNRSSLVEPDFVDGSTVPFLGKNYLLRIRNGNKKTSVKLQKDQIVINLKSKKPMKKLIKKDYEDWLFSKATRYLQSRTRNLAEKTHLKPSKIIIKRLRDRWGSATKERSINLNFYLMKAPKNIIDYVIIHELCHLVVRDHSFNYWKLLKKFVPDYKDKISWLEKNDLIHKK